MNTKRMMRWGIVLFLLAALPVMTAVMAQGQEPGAPQAPATWNVYESEPNDTRATADLVSIGDVVGGFIECTPGPYVGMDYFRFHVAKNGFVLIEADWDNIGSEGLDPIITLMDSTGRILDYVENGDGLDEAVLFYGLDPGDYYVEILDFEGDFCGPDQTYELLIYSPLLISASAANLGTGYVDGIPFKSGDILAHSDLNNGTERWTMLFDASDVGITVNVSNIAAGGDDTLLLTLGANQVLQGVGTVTPWDIVIFDSYWYGQSTNGTFRMGLDGSEHQLTTSGEKLDAIAVSQYCDYLSTTGTATVPYYMGYNIKFKDEDLGCWYSDEEWLWGFESRFVTGLPVEDVLAAAYDDSADKMYLTILGNGRIFGHNVTQKDIFAVNWPGYNPNYTWGGLVWHGPDHGWNYNIDAIEWTGW